MFLPAAGENFLGCFCPPQAKIFGGVFARRRRKFLRVFLPAAGGKNMGVKILYMAKTKSLTLIPSLGVESPADERQKENCTGQCLSLSHLTTRRERRGFCLTFNTYPSSLDTGLRTRGEDKKRVPSPVSTD